MQGINLGGNWKIESTDGEYSLEGTVPGTVFEHLDPDPSSPDGIFFRENNRRCLRIADRAFVFLRTFTWSPGRESGDRRVLLECDGLDTLATVILNGHEVARTKNMHRRYRFDVTEAIEAGENQIQIHFDNALEYVRREHARRPLWHAYLETPEYAFPGFNTIRKSHCSFGWDWGPIVPDVGIWRDIRLVAYSGARIEQVALRQAHEAKQHHPGRTQKVTLTVDVEAQVWEPAIAVASAPEGPLYAQARLSLPDGRELTAEATIGNDGLGSAQIEVPDAPLWWPNGLGEQPLCNLTVELRRGEAVLDARTKRIGLRTMEVIREPDEWGESFAFAVNDVPVFARGADYIPEDVALTRATPAHTRALLEDAAAANFNCIRVWGGGVYPSDDFFDACDELGLIVWQDLMFACALYDIDSEEFVAEITHEARDNLRRVRHHASLGLICGNNEMEWGFEEWGFPHTKHNRTEYLRQYQMILAEVAAIGAPEVFYWPASPSSGGDFEEPNAPERGDCHFWDVWHKNKEYTEYSKHFFRFMSEFGFESFPALETIETFTLPEDRNVFSPVMEDHQRCLGGNDKILAYLAKYFRYPSTLGDLVYLSQISQAEALRHGIEHWRRNRGRCMGSVYWQLNDNWPVASWSSIDYYGRWKAAHYLAKRAYDPVLVSAARVGNVAEIHLSNESPLDVDGQIRWSLMRTDGSVIEAGEGRAPARAFSSACVTTVELGEHLAAAGDRGSGMYGAADHPERELILAFEFAGTDGHRSRGVLAFAPYKQISLQPPEIEASFGEEHGGLITIEIGCTRPALFVEISLIGAERTFSDNFFHLWPGAPVMITVPTLARGLLAQRVTGTDTPLAIEQVSQLLRIRSLVDSYTATGRR